jgi:hypothetical protein
VEVGGVAGGLVGGGKGIVFEGVSVIVVGAVGGAGLDFGKGCFDGVRSYRYSGMVGRSGVTSAGAAGGVDSTGVEALAVVFDFVSHLSYREGGLDTLICGAVVVAVSKTLGARAEVVSRGE